MILHTFTPIDLIPMYSGWKQKNFVVVKFSASVAACSFVGSSTSQTAKHRRQKYCPEILAVRISSSNISFYYPANLPVLISTKTSEIMWGSRALDISGIGKMTLPWKYGAYLPTLSLSYSSGLICRTFKVAGVLLPVGLWPVCIGLSEGIDYCVFLGQETGKTGQLALLLLAAGSSGSTGKAFLLA